MERCEWLIRHDEVSCTATFDQSCPQRRTTNEQWSFVVVQTGNLSCTHPITPAYPCKHYLSTLQTDYKSSKSAGTRIENIPPVVDLAAFPAPYLYPLNADLTNDQRVKQTASIPKPSPLRTIAFSTPKSSVNSVLRALIEVMPKSS